jgi:hypothetical protein
MACMLSECDEYERANGRGYLWRLQPQTGTAKCYRGQSRSKRVSVPERERNVSLFKIVERKEAEVILL